MVSEKEQKITKQCWLWNLEDNARAIYVRFNCSWFTLITWREREREMFYLTMHSTHFIYGYMASDIWLRTILIVRKETCCRHIGYSYRLTARVLLYAPSHRQDNTYHGLCYPSRGALAGTRNSSMGSPHEGSIQQPTAPWANALPLSYVLLPLITWRRGGRSSSTVFVFSSFSDTSLLRSSAMYSRVPGLGFKSSFWVSWNSMHAPVAGIREWRNQC